MQSLKLNFNVLTHKIASLTDVEDVMLLFMWRARNLKNIQFKKGTFQYVVATPELFGPIGRLVCEPCAPPTAT